jgi:predicted nucleotidyltransferase
MNFETIKSRAQLVFAGKPIKKAFLFGSHARLESHLNSDLDILVELDEDKVIGMIEYIKIIEELEMAFQTKVDLVSSDSVSKHLKPFIDSDKLLIYEA